MVLNYVYVGPPPPSDRDVRQKGPWVVYTDREPVSNGPRLTMDPYFRSLLGHYLVIYLDTNQSDPSYLLFSDTLQS